MGLIYRPNYRLTRVRSLTRPPGQNGQSLFTIFCVDYITNSPKTRSCAIQCRQQFTRARLADRAFAHHLRRDAVHRVPLRARGNRQLPRM